MRRLEVLLSRTLISN